MTPTSTSHRRLRIAVTVLAIATAAALAILGARRLDRVPEGLRAQYFPNNPPDAPPALSVVDRQPSSEDLFADFTGTAPEAFRASWNGWIVAPRGGTYTFATASDQHSELEIDGRLVLQNGGSQDVPARGTIDLARGVHSVLLRYVHIGGVPAIAFLWARGGALEPVPGWALRPRYLPYRRFVADAVMDAAAIGAVVGWPLALLLCAGFAAWPTLTAFRARAIGDAWPALAGLVAGSAMLNLIGLSWGLPGGTWVGDELIPLNVLRAISARFAHGWFEIYPPLHFYILSIADGPVLALHWLGLLGVQTPMANTVMFVTARLVSVVMGAGILVAAFLCGRRAFGVRAALFAAAMLALAAPFIYYSKTANVEVPYLFWLSLTLLFYLRVLDGAPIADYVCWALFATCAICTKDQAYAFCLPMPGVALYEMWRANLRDGEPGAFRRALADRRLLAAAVVSVAVFALCQNLALNWSGFDQHVAFITGRKVERYQAFASTIEGRWLLLRLTGRLVELSLGWPVFIATVAGVIGALVSAPRRRMAIWLLIPVAAYYLGFINVVLYNYDRFVMPMVLVLVLFGGFALDRLAAPGAPLRAWRLAVVGALFAYTLLYGATVDVLMVRDSRYTVEAWLAARVGRNDVVGTSGIPRYLPRLERFRTLDVDRVETLSGARPAFLVMNADYTRSEPADTPLGELIAAVRGGRANYRLVLRARTPSPWPWLPAGHADLIGPRLEAESVSFLRNINPTIEVFARQ